MDALQADIDQLESEKAELKQRINNQSRAAEGFRGPQASGIASIVTGNAAGGVSGVSGEVQVVDSPLLKQQIDVQRLAIKQLKSENYRLKAEKMRAQLSSLPPLQPVNMTKEAPAGSLYRRTDLLLNNLLKMSVGIRVVDISGKTSASASSQLLEQTAKMKSLSDALDKLKADVSQHIVSQRPGARMPSDFATFPSASFVKAKVEQQIGSVLVGKVMIPCARSVEQTHRLVLSQQQLQRVHRLLMT
ncbi:dynactin subunit 1-like [Sinocyclocheilus anshuiensis]|uniref:dynactin subunit 1-like n=1 Tax=Sinocyclocheilus anshuiensis TaxID=1608454 RepID=UPI0007B81480|nr:PREDICTED: dynactin subunit 1-like [Sinocyclocheilus anshuiensis]